MTQAETIFWELVRNNKVQGYHFRRQQVIDGFISDFFCNQLNLVVEIDGGVHEHQKDYDAERERIISRHGMTFLRFANFEVIDHPDMVMQRLVNTITTITAPSPAGKGTRG